MLSILGIFADFAPVGASQRSHVVAGSGPVITWRASSLRPGAEQSAYRITAGNYDSSWVCSNAQRAQLPEGTLAPGERVHVSLRIRDCFGEESAPLEEILYNAARQWDAPWIGIRGAGENPCT